MFFHFSPDFCNLPPKRKSPTERSEPVKVSKSKPQPTTRGQTAKKFCGVPNALTGTSPPTYREVIQHANHLRTAGLTEFAIAKQTSEEVEKVWRQVNPQLPIIASKSIANRVDRLLKAVKEIDQKKPKHSKKKTDLSENLDKLFDIASCNCDLPERDCKDDNIKCTVKDCVNVHLACLCPLKSKVPTEERQYLKSERQKIGSKGEFQLGSVDKKSIKKNVRKTRDIPSCSKSESPLTPELAFSSSSDQQQESCEEFSSEEFPVPTYNLVKLPRFAMELVRCDISSRIYILIRVVNGQQWLLMAVCMVC